MSARTGWTYEGYWQAVLGLSSAREVVQNFLLPAHRAHRGDGALPCAEGAAYWLEEIEGQAWRAGGSSEPVPDEWARFREMAAGELCAALAAAFANSDGEDAEMHS